jgi:tetrahydromethanopterin S-methyltransferase subunit G
MSKPIGSCADVTLDDHAKVRERSIARFIRVLFCIFIGIILGATITGLLVSVFSDNVHDKSLEAANTAAFLGAPIGAIAGLIAGLIWKMPARAR